MRRCIGCLILLTPVWVLSGDDLYRQVVSWIENDTEELPTGSDFLCTSANFKNKAKSPVLIISENYFVRKTKRVAMSETRRVPIRDIREISILENVAQPTWKRRFMVLIKYTTINRKSKVYLKQKAKTGEDFGAIQAFTLGSYTQKQATKIVKGLTQICENVGVAVPQ